MESLVHIQHGDIDFLLYQVSTVILDSLAVHLNSLSYDSENHPCTELPILYSVILYEHLPFELVLRPHSHPQKGSHQLPTCIYDDSFSAYHSPFQQSRG